MRVIINGIEKFPSFCGECFLMDGETRECSVPGVERTCNPYDGRYDDCPMSPLQTHGRLGDLDALAEYVHQQDDWLSETAIHAFCGILCKTPTIIPAEPSEEQREYESAVEYAQYCEIYEPSYDPETGAL